MWLAVDNTWECSKDDRMGLVRVVELEIFGIASIVCVLACSYNVDDKISGFVAVAYGMLLALVLKRVTIRVEVMGVMTLQRNT